MEERRQPPKEETLVRAIRLIAVAVVLLGSSCSHERLPGRPPSLEAKDPRQRPVGAQDKTLAWVAGTPLPSERNHPTAVTLNGYAYVLQRACVRACQLI